MNFLSVFEERIGGVFGSGSQAAAPFSFKKLAKKASNEMEKETYVINGVDTAPALFTVLVSQEDDAAMKPLYLRLTQETALFLEAHAQRRGYTFVGKPLVRFMVDPSLKHGKFSVFAENVDVRTLERLRDEEERYADGHMPRPSKAQAPQPAAPQPRRQPVDLGLGPIGSPDTDDPSAGLTAMPASMAMDVMEDAYAMEQAAARQAEAQRLQHQAQQPAPAGVGQTPARPIANVPLVNPRADYMQAVPHISHEAAMAQQAAVRGGQQLANLGAQPLAPAAPAAGRPAVPPTQMRNVPLVNGRQPQQAAAPQQAGAILIDRQSGRTYSCTSDRCVIGRERSTGGIVLHDPNVSRRHAELANHGGYWTITDLNSTNGTLVNDVDVDECTLRDGDLITLGLTNLEFREG